MKKVLNRFIASLAISVFGVCIVSNTEELSSNPVSTEIVVEEIESSANISVVEEELSIELNDIPRMSIHEEMFLESQSEPEELVDEDNVETVDCGLTNEEIELIALITMAEAEGECELGKRLVIDTILNRVDSEHFPNTVTEVIYQQDQFTSMWNGRIDVCYVMDDICQLVREELQSRQNYEVVFFRTEDYHKFGEPVMPVGNHYFSKY